MEKRTLGRAGLIVSAVGFGGAPIGFLTTEQPQIEEIVNTLLDSGVNLIDTAAAYVGSEKSLGNVVAQRRKEMVLVSKCGQQFDDLPGAAWSREVIRATIDRSLRLLRTDYLDVMLLHSCSLRTLQRGEAVEALAEARKAGKIRYAGYSGDNEAAVYAASLPEIAVIETSVNICDQANIDMVLPVTREKKVGVITKRPLANTAWRPLNQLKGLYQEYAKDYRQRFEKMGLSIQELGFKDDSDWPEAALRFTLSQPGVTVAIVGTTNPINAKRNLEAAAKGPLPDDVCQKIRLAFQQARGEESWPGLT